MIKRTRLWTDEEIEFVKKNYKTQTNSDIAKHLGRSLRGVERQAEKLKLRKNKIYKKKVMEKKMTEKPIENGEEEETEEELIEHTVEIDEYLRAVIKIPKVLTPMDLKALMVKANKLFNLSEVPIISGPKRQYVRRNGLNDEEKRKLVERYNKGSDQDREDLARSMGVSVKGLYQKIWTIKKNYQDKVKGVAIDGMDLVEKYDNSNTEERRQLAQDLGTTTGRLSRKIWYLKNRSKASREGRKSNSGVKKYNEIMKQVAERHLKTKEPIGKLLREILGRQPGGTDYINVKKCLEH